MSKAEELSQNRYSTLAEKCAFIDGWTEKDLELTNETIQATCYGFQNGEALFTFRLPAKTYLVGSKINIIIK